MNRLSRPLVAIIVTTFAVQLLMLVTDMGPRLPLVAAACVLLGVAIWLVLGVGNAAVRTEAVSEPHPPPPTKLPDLRVTLLRQGLSYGRHDNQIPDRMYVSLVALIDDELAVSHGIDRVSEPDAARAVIGDDLMRFIDDPPAAKSLSLEGLTAIVTLIERIRPEVPA